MNICKYEQYVKNQLLNGGFQSPETRQVADRYGDTIRALFKDNPNTHWDHIRDVLTPVIGSEYAAHVDFSDLWATFSVEHHCAAF